jgi:hypothetical protein
MEEIHNEDWSDIKKDFRYSEEGVDKQGRNCKYLCFNETGIK